MLSLDQVQSLSASGQPNGPSDEQAVTEQVANRSLLVGLARCGAGF